MTLRCQDIHYDGPGGPFVGTLHWDDSLTAPRPGVIVCPAFRGKSPFEQARAQELAERGYVGFAMDYYGNGVTIEDATEAHAAKNALDADRPLLAARMEVALAALKTAPQVDPERTAAIGYCFGGKAVLDLARQGADLKGVAAFHGILDRAASAPEAAIRARILVMHGWDDPLAPPQSVLDFGAEMTARDVDWQLHAYGGTGHAFTNPAAQPGAQLGFGFKETARDRSWTSVKSFLTELFA